MYDQDVLAQFVPFLWILRKHNFDRQLIVIDIYEYLLQNIWNES